MYSLGASLELDEEDWLTWAKQGWMRFCGAAGGIIVFFSDNWAEAKVLSKLIEMPEVGFKMLLVGYLVEEGSLPSLGSISDCSVCLKKLSRVELAKGRLVGVCLGVC